MTFPEIAIHPGGVRVLGRCHQAFSDRGHGVDVQNLSNEALRFLTETRTTHPQVRDRDNAAYGLMGVPETFFVNRAGRIVRKFPGAVTRPDEWFGAVDEALD